MTHLVSNFEGIYAPRRGPHPANRRADGRTLPKPHRLLNHTSWHTLRRSTRKVRSIQPRYSGASGSANENWSAPSTCRHGVDLRLLEDGDHIDLGDRVFEVIHTPGHSPGGIALFEAKTGVLFSGDILYDGPLIEDTYHSNADDYLASMERLLTIPARIVHGGHFPSFSGERYRTLIRNWLAEKQKTN